MKWHERVSELSIPTFVVFWIAVGCIGGGVAAFVRCIVVGDIDPAVFSILVTITGAVVLKGVLEV